MAIYHLEAKIVSRGSGRSACAAAAYMSCSKILNDYDGVEHDYTRKRGLVWGQVFLPQNAPAEWQDRSVLWNAVEEEEKTKDSRLAREFVAALPVELGRDEWKKILSEFIEQQFVADGMCADVVIHDTGTGNPHAHIMLTVRPLDKNGKWQYKTEKEYLCVRNGEERGFTAAEFKIAQTEGWEKQYPYKVGKKKIYMAPSEAEVHGYERADKHPKSTKFGRQNPITARWNSEDQLVKWREAWAECVNRNLEQRGLDERIDHRSFADRGIDEQPTIHEGVVARALEAKGIISDRCELNRQIMEDNRMLRALKADVKRLSEMLKNSIPALAEALENLRSKLIVLCYKLINNAKRKNVLQRYIDVVKPDLDRYLITAGKLKEKIREKKSLVAQKKETPLHNVMEHIRLSSRISELTEEIEDQRSEKAMRLSRMNCSYEKDIRTIQNNVSSAEANMKKYDDDDVKTQAELDSLLSEIEKMTIDSADVDQAELLSARLDIRPDYEHDAAVAIQEHCGKNYDPQIMQKSHEQVMNLLHEERASLRDQLHIGKTNDPRNEPDELQPKRHQFNESKRMH